MVNPFSSMLFSISVVLYELMPTTTALLPVAPRYTATLVILAPCLPMILVRLDMIPGSSTASMVRRVPGSRKPSNSIKESKISLSVIMLTILDFCQRREES